MITEELSRDDQHCFDNNHLYRQALSLWNNAKGDEVMDHFRKYNDREKEQNEKNLLQIIKKAEGAKSKDQLKKILEKFIFDGPMFSSEGKKILRDPGFFQSSETFIAKVQNYDGKMPKEDIGQAFRNVWIMNLLQRIFEIPVACTEGVFGYSMLYPYTDNLMDDPDLNREEKHLICQRLHRRLLGIREQAVNREEVKIYDMIEKIEKVFPRELYPQVYESLLYIHESQVQSLLQQTFLSGDLKDEDNLGSKLSPYFLKEVSFHKGGASVLADGFLVKGNLSNREKAFCFNYGVVLQMADDLQDCKEDHKNQHQTLFSQDFGKKRLDPKAEQLMNFAKIVFESFFDDRKHRGMKVFLLENTLLLVLTSILLNPSCFSKEYLQRAEKHYPVSRDFLIDQEQAFSKKFRKHEGIGMKESIKV